MTETPLSLPEKKPADRFWWLPVPLLFIFPFVCELPIAVHDWLFPPQPSDEGIFIDGSCWSVLFLSSIPGTLALCAFMSLPVILPLAKHTVFRKNLSALPIAAYILTTIAGLAGTMRLEIWGGTHLAIESSNTPVMHCFHILAIAALWFGLIALIIGWRQKQIRIRSLLIVSLSAILIHTMANLVWSLGGAGDSCVGS